MSKKNGNGSMTLHGHEQSTLRILLASREQASASVAAASANVRNYLIQLLQGRGLDPQKWGVSPDMTSFVEIQQPTPAAVPTSGPQPVAESTPAPAPAPAPAS